METPTERIAVGRALRHARKTAEMTLEKVAGQIGITLSALAQIERGEVSVTAERLRELADVYGIQVADLYAPPYREDAAS